MLKRIRSAIYGAPDLPKLKAFYSALLDPNAAPVAQACAFWKVDALPEVLARAKKLSATVDGEPREVGGGITMAVVRDPCGNRLGLIAETGTHS